MSRAPTDYLGSEKNRSGFNWLKVVFFGICMGIADIIPGISGGTIAYIMGFYEDLLNSISSLNIYSLKLLLKGQFKLFFKRVSFPFIISLLLGIVLSMVTLAHLVTYILNHDIYRSLLYSLFFGLITAAAIIQAFQIKNWSIKHVSFFLLTVFLGFMLTQAKFTPKETDLYDINIVIVDMGKKIVNYNYESKMLTNVSKNTVSAMIAKGIITPQTILYSHLDKQPGIAKDFIAESKAHYIDPWIILCGAIAICAMILPGISGSYLLTILGMYAVVIGALADFTGALAKGFFDEDAFLILSNMLTGIIIGAVTFTRVVQWLLNKYHDVAIAMLTGFMIGALPAVWPFWSYSYSLNPLKLEKGLQLAVIDPILPALNIYTVSAIMLSILGGTLVFLIQYISRNFKFSSSS